MEKIIIEFPDVEYAALFRAWLMDGGGEDSYSNVVDDAGLPTAGFMEYPKDKLAFSRLKFFT